MSGPFLALQNWKADAELHIQNCGCELDENKSGGHSVTSKSNSLVSPTIVWWGHSQIGKKNPIEARSKCVCTCFWICVFWRSTHADGFSGRLGAFFSILAMLWKPSGVGPSSPQKHSLGHSLEITSFLFSLGEAVTHVPKFLYQSRVEFPQRISWLLQQSSV